MSEDQYFDTLLISYENGNKDWVFAQYQKMEPAKQERFLDYVAKETDIDQTSAIYYSLLKRIL